MREFWSWSRPGADHTRYHWRLGMPGARMQALVPGWDCTCKLCRPWESLLACNQALCGTLGWACGPQAAFMSLHPARSQTRAQAAAHLCHTQKRGLSLNSCELLE